MTPRRGMAALLALLVILVGPLVASAAAGDHAGVLLPVDESGLLILEVHAERYLASRGLIGFLHEEQVLLPLGELAAVLEFAVHADVKRGVAEGWLIDESRTFRLDVASRSVTVDGHQQGLTKPCLYIDDEDIYATSDMVARWWPIDLEIDLRGLRVVIRPREPVPLITRLNREMLWSKRSQRDGAGPQYPQERAPYRLAAWPFLDASISLHADRRRNNLRSSLLSRGDLARLSVTSFVSYERSTDNAWTAWLRAGRSDRDAGLLGPLAATNFEFGDVSGEIQPLIGASVRGRGVSVTNRPLGSVTEFEAVDVNGEAPPGWDVELYLNGALYDIVTTGGDGRYVFTAVPLRLGLSTIRTVQHGPHGQTREQVRSYNVRTGMWQPGQLHYHYASVQAGRSIIGSHTSLARLRGQGHWNHQFDLGYGLSPRATAGVSLISVHADDRRHDYLQARLLQSLGGVFLHTVAVADLDGGFAGSLSSQMQLRNQNLYAGFSKFSDFTSNTAEGSGKFTHRGETRLTGALRPWQGQPLSYRLRWQNDKYNETVDLTRNTLDLYLGGSLRRLSVGHELTYINDRGAMARDAVLGRLLLAGYILRARIRGDVEYDLSDGADLRSLGATASYVFRDDLTGQLVARRSFLPGGSTSVRGSLDWHLRSVRLGLNLGHDSAVGASFGVSAATSLLRAPNGGPWLVLGQRLSQYGAAMVTTYIDRDQDGVFGPADEPLAGVGFRRSPLWRDIVTDDTGQALLPGIQPNQFVNVTIDLTTVDDPYLVPVYGGMTTVVHPGGIVNLVFPFRNIGEIEGVVARDSLGARTLRNIGLELLDGGNQRVGTAVSEFDGYYVFQNVLPGDYHIKVVERTLRGRKFVVPSPQPVSVPPHGDYVPGPTIVLMDPDAPPLGEPAELLVAEAVEQTAPTEPTVPTEESDQPAQPAPIRPVTPPPAAPPVIAPAPVTDATTPAPDVVRTLHLLYELLYESKLFEKGR